MDKYLRNKKKPQNTQILDVNTKKSNHKISLAKFKKIMGVLADKYSDVELEDVLRFQYGFAELAFEVWRSKKG